MDYQQGTLLLILGPIFIKHFHQLPGWSNPMHPMNYFNLRQQFTWTLEKPQSKITPRNLWSTPMETAFSTANPTHLCIFEKWLAEKEVPEKGLKDKVTSRLSIIKQGHTFIASEPNHTLGYVLS